jgi:hypothetical protein
VLILIAFDHDDMSSKVNENVRATERATTINFFIEDYCDLFFELFEEVVSDVLLFDLVATRDLNVGVEVAVAVETIRSETITRSDVDLATESATAFGGAYNTLSLLSFVLANPATSALLALSL